MPDQREQIINFVKEHGPVLPSHVAKAANLSILFASAYLSELVDKKHIKISWIKVGGSPLYYCQGQEEKLEKYTENLNDKDKETFNLIKKNKLLKDSDQIPLVRVSLRSLKDFALPIEINGEIFWKFYNVTDDQIREIFAKKEEATQEVKKEVQQKIETQVKLPETTDEPEKIVEETKKEVEQLLSTGENAEIKKKRGRPKKIVQEVPKQEEIQQVIVEKLKDSFILEMEGFFSSHNIKVIEFSLIKKGNEADFIIMLPTHFGETKYYCKTKNKKSINEGDISSALVQAHFRKLPGLLIAPGKLTKRAQEMLNKEAHGLLFKQI